MNAEKDFLAYLQLMFPQHNYTAKDFDPSSCAADGDIAQLWNAFKAGRDSLDKEVQAKLMAKAISAWGPT